MNNQAAHVSVLLNEVLEYLDPKPGSCIIDATLNGGGHTEAIAQRVAPDGKVIGIEWDPTLASETKTRFQQSEYKDVVTVVNDSYVNLEQIAQDHNCQPDGILFDLGLSSWHYERSGRGFSFKRDEPLDMRFNPDTKVGAQEIVNTYSVPELSKLLTEYGEEQFAEQIAEAIRDARKTKLITTVLELVVVIEQAVPNWYKHRKIHFATKTFQALRVAVNDELGNVHKGVEAAIRALKPGGRLVVISFQGHEDKIVRELFKKYKKEGVITQPVSGTVRPTWPEQEANPRSRSAKMKVAQKI